MSKCTPDGGRGVSVVDAREIERDNGRDGMTTANKITILRILLVPFFVAQVIYYLDEGEEIYRFWAIVSFVVAAGSDGLDGFIARRYNQRSELGTILDPIADKLLLISGIVLLSLHNEPHFHRIPLWLGATVVGRDIIILIGFAVIYYTCGKITIHPRFSGKTATVLQMIVVLWVLLKWDASGLRYWAISTAALTGVSGIQYVFDGVNQLSASPSSVASSRHQTD